MRCMTTTIFFLQWEALTRISGILDFSVSLLYKGDHHCCDEHIDNNTIHRVERKDEILLFEHDTSEPGDIFYFMLGGSFFSRSVTNRKAPASCT